MKFTKRNIAKLERLINETFDELEERPLYKLEDFDGYIEFRFDGTLYDLINETDMIYESIGKEINEYIHKFDNMEFYSMSVIRFYK